jgi:hypothetical protein
LAVGTPVTTLWANAEMQLAKEKWRALAVALGKTRKPWPSVLRLKPIKNSFTWCAG